MSHKSRGIAGERELIHLFNNAEWVAFRAAASGASRYPCPDVIAGNNLRKLAIEAKTTKNKYKYFTKQEIRDLKLFANTFGAEPWVAIKFLRKGWYFLTLEDLKETPNNFMTSLPIAERRGLSFEDLITNFK